MKGPPLDTRALLHGLYVIVDPAMAGGRDPIGIAREAIAGGARLIQLRDKAREKGIQLPLAGELQALCRERGALFFINDHVDLALAAHADGVHLGQKDLPVAVVRRLVPNTMLIGCSTNNAREALKAEADGADYVSVGRLFPTGSKQDTRPATLDTIRAVKSAVSVPVCAIGGIDESNIDDVIAAGADMVSVIGAVVSADDVREAASRLARRFASAGGQR
ncbi:MAG TPA: thiamine phosphate synthase [Dehalococcoidia bacterium]|nr:thiamine phosphate synthase [Dehalococcoidia bacterium]